MSVPRRSGFGSDFDICVFILIDLLLSGFFYLLDEECIRLIHTLSNYIINLTV